MSVYLSAHLHISLVHVAMSVYKCESMQVFICTQGHACAYMCIPVLKLL